MIPNAPSNADENTLDGLGLSPKRHVGREPVRIMLIGSSVGINSIAKLLHRLGFAEIGDWSKPQPYPNSDKKMSIVTKWIQR